MNQRHANWYRPLVIAAVAVAVLLALNAATSGGSPTTSSPAPTATSAATPAATTGGLQASVSTRVHKLADNVIAFTYTVRSGEHSTVAGFQLNGGSANLYALHAPAGWNVFGQGVCAGRYPGVLVYWSTGSSPIPSGTSRTFGFRVRTLGITTLASALSQGKSVLFGHVAGPQPSTLSAPAHCK